MKKTFGYLIVIAIVIGVSLNIGYKYGYIGDNSHKVAIEKVERRTITETVSASGKIQPSLEVIITPEVSGELIEINVKEGDTVRQGQLLCKIRPDYFESDYQRSSAMVNEVKANQKNAKAQLESAKIQLKNEQANFKRQEALFKDKVISQAEYDDAEAKFEQAKQNVNSAQQAVDAANYTIKSQEASLNQSGVNLAKTTLYSPINGVITIINSKVGERVLGTEMMAGTEVMKIADFSNIEAVVDVNENDINRLSIGNTATVEVDAFFDKKFTGKVTSIANTAKSDKSATSTDQVTTFEVKVKLDPESYSNEDTKGRVSPFRPGLSTTVDINTTEVKDVLSVPIQSVTTRTKAVVLNDIKLKDKFDDITIVFVADSNKAKAIPVVTGIQDEKYIEIISGLKGDESVIVAPYLSVTKTLLVGEKLKIVTQDELYSENKK